jgi:acyl carrier protein phosphodiesterase
MTPKEKAQDIFNKMLFEIKYNCQPSLNKMVAKKCSLIAVDEIYNEIDDNYDTLHSSDRKQYWQEVKKEIELL